MKIVITGIHYAITAALEYLTRAAKRAGHEVLTAGAHHGINMPWKNGMLVSKAYDFIPDIPLPNFPEIPIRLVENQLGDFKPDLWLDVNAGQSLVGTPKSGIRATFLTDPHVMGATYKKLAVNYAYMFNPQKSYWLSDLREKQHLVLYGADSEWHKPQDVEKKYDVALLGNIYQQRVELFTILERRGAKIKFGLGDGKWDVGRIYSQSKIGVNWSSMDDITARVFEIAACGICPVYNQVPYLDEILTPGEDYIPFSDLMYAQNIIIDTLQNEELMIKMGASARAKIVSGKHFWDDRFQQMLEIMNLV